MCETQRLQFIENRDGKEASLEFARRTMKQYRQAILCSRKRGMKPHHASIPEYRRSFIESYYSFKQYIRNSNA